MKKNLGTLLCASFLLSASDLEWANSACKEGDGGGCAMLGAMYLNGVGVKQNHKKALNFYLKGLFHK